MLFSADTDVMGEDTPPPLLFANQVISEMVAHTMGEEMLVEYRDYMALRTAFRHCGGTWAGLADGDVRQVDLLRRLVSVWGAMDGRVNTSETLI